MMEPGTKIGILVGISIMGLASWVHALSSSETLQGWLPGVWEAVQFLDTAAPFIVFLGAWILFFALLRRPLLAIIIATAIAIALGLLIWF